MASMTERFRGVKAQGPPGAHVKQFPFQVEDAGLELMQPAGLAAV